MTTSHDSDFPPDTGGASIPETPAGTTSGEAAWTAPESTPGGTPGGTRGGLDGVMTGLAWIAILLAASLWMMKPALLEDATEPGGEIAVPAGLLVGPQDELAGRMTLGLDRWLPEAGGVDQAAPLATGTPAQRVAHAILVTAISGAEKGLGELDRIESGPVSDLLVPLARNAIESSDSGDPPSSEVIADLEARLGWFGTLASELADPAAVDRLAEDARTALFWVLGLVSIFVVAGLAGLVGIIVLVVLFATSGRPFRIPVVSRHGIYAETFAIWLFGMLVLQIAAGLLATESTVLLASVVAFFASLSVLAWPVIRGRAWADVRTELGLVRPRVSDLPIGVATWAMALPFLGIGVMLTLILTVVAQFLSGEAPQPSHPATEAAAGAGAWQIVQLFLLASVAAPIVEETFFRGVLLTHLRGATRRWNQWVSFVFAATVSSVIFAAIHPQGLVFIPPLAGLAVGFCVGRAWQGSLIPAIVAHGVSNALVMSLNVILFA